MYLSDPQKLLEIVGDNPTPLYVYDLEKVRVQYQNLDKAISYPNKRIFYAVKANWNADILATLKSLGSGIECVSRGEVEQAISQGFKPKDIIFTGSGQRRKDLEWVANQNIQVNADSLNQLEWLGQLGQVEKVSVRINNDVGDGHHNHVITGGAKSKFGIHYTNIDAILELASKYNLIINGLHQHIGSHILEEHIFVGAMQCMYENAAHFPDLEFIDFGGSFGVPYQPGDRELDINKLGSLISDSFGEFSKNYGRPIHIYFEPGRYLVAESGTLLVTVTDIKQHPSRMFTLVDSGMNHLARPAMYGSYHHITNISNPNGEMVTTSVGGNICESGDIFAHDRQVATPRIGDMIAINTAGAYGYSMSSRYNLHIQPKEICY